MLFHNDFLLGRFPLNRGLLSKKQYKEKTIQNIIEFFKVNRLLMNSSVLGHALKYINADTVVLPLVELRDKYLKISKNSNFKKLQLIKIFLLKKP